MSKDDRYAHLSDDAQDSQETTATSTDEGEQTEEAVSDTQPTGDPTPAIQEPFADINGLSVYIESRDSTDQLRVELEDESLTPDDVVAALEQVGVREQFPSEFLTTHGTRTVALASAVGASVGAIVTTAALRRLRE